MISHIRNEVIKPSGLIFCEARSDQFQSQFNTFFRCAAHKFPIII